MRIKHFAIAVVSTVALVVSAVSFAAPAQPGQVATLQPGSANAASAFTPEQTQQIEKIVHDYLIKNPQVMVQVIKSLQKQERAKMQERSEKAVRANAKQLFDSTSSPIVGNPQGKVTLVEFFDYQCPHCRRMAKVVNQLVKDNSDLRVVYKELPIFPGSTIIAKAALASMNQGKYAEFHNALMKDPITPPMQLVQERKSPKEINAFMLKQILKIAKSVGINTKQLEKDMQSASVENELKQNLQLAQALRLVGTPAFIVGSNVNAGPEQMKTFFIPGQVPQTVLQDFIAKATAAIQTNAAKPAPKS